MADKIVIIGAGAAGANTAIKLANQGHKVVLIEKNTLGSGASGRNPGRMGHGFHYTDVQTALDYLHASIKVQRTYPGFLIAQDKPNSPLRHGRYFIMKDSGSSQDEILLTYEKIKAEYARMVEEDPRNEVFGPPENFYRILEPSEYSDTVNMDLVEMGVETNEHLFRWSEFKDHLRNLIEHHPNIELREHTEVEQIVRNLEGQTRFSFSLLTSTPAPRDATNDDLSTGIIQYQV